MGDEASHRAGLAAAKSKIGHGAAKPTKAQLKARRSVGGKAKVKNAKDARRILGVAPGTSLAEYARANKLPGAKKAGKPKVKTQQFPPGGFHPKKGGGGGGAAAAKKKPAVKKAAKAKFKPG